MNVDGAQPCCREDGGDGGAARGRQLDHGDTTRVEKPRQIGGNRTIGGKTVSAGDKRERRLMPQFGFSLGEFGQGEVGRIGDHEIEPAAQGLGPEGADEARPIRYAVGGGIAPRELKRAKREIRADTEGGAKIGQQRYEQAARTGAEIEHPKRFGLTVGEPLARELDQKFALRTRHKHVRADFKTAAQEFASAADVGERFARQTALKQRRKPRFLGRR